MTTRTRFMRPCKSSYLDNRSLFDMYRLVKNKNGMGVPVLIGPHKLGPNKHGQYVPMVKTLCNKCWKITNCLFLLGSVLKDKAQVTTKMIISTFLYICILWECWGAHIHCTRVLYDPGPGGSVTPPPCSASTAARRGPGTAPAARPHPPSSPPRNSSQFWSKFIT